MKSDLTFAAFVIALVILFVAGIYLSQFSHGIGRCMMKHEVLFDPNICKIQ